MTKILAPTKCRRTSKELVGQGGIEHRWVVATVIHYLERLFDYSRTAGGIVAGNEKLVSEIIWPHFWAIQIVLIVLILNYCVIRELSRVLGEERMMALFFGRRAKAAARRETTVGEP